MFWNKLVILCNSKNITPNKMCADLGLSNAVATKWKNGSVPRSTTLKQISEYFGVNYSYFDDKVSPPEEIPQGLDEKTAEILSMYSQLSDEHKKQALSYLEYLAQRRASEENQ